MIATAPVSSICGRYQNGLIESSQTMNMNKISKIVSCVRYIVSTEVIKSKMHFMVASQI